MSKRKVYCLTTFLLFISCISKSQNLNKQYSSFINAIQEFIDSSKINSIGHSEKYVYCLKLYSDKKDTNSYGFAITFIVNDWDTAGISAEYLFNIKNETIIINTDSFIQQRWFNKINLIPFNNKERQKVINKLLKTKTPDGGWTYADFDPPRLLVLYKNENVSKKYYKNAAKMPLTPVKYPEFEIKEVTPPK